MKKKPAAKHQCYKPIVNILIPGEDDDDKQRNFNLDRDLFYLVCGPIIGEGATREVRECRINKRWVVKVAKKNDGFCDVPNAYQNLREWHIWRMFNEQLQKHAEWLAPCVAVSANGYYLIQQRIEPLARSQWPKRLPGFMADLKDGHLGLFDGRVVLCDYANIEYYAELNKKLVPIID